MAGRRVQAQRVFSAWRGISVWLRLVFDANDAENAAPDSRPPRISHLVDVRNRHRRRQGQHGALGPDRVVTEYEAVDPGIGKLFEQESLADANAVVQDQLLVAGAVRSAHHG